MAIGLTACSEADSERAKQEAHQTGEKLRVESKEALRQAEVDAHKASRELNEDLEKARAKTRKALDQPDTDHR